MLAGVTIEKIEPVFEDERGKIFDLLEDEEILHVGIITSTKGSVRGNHYHNVAKQFNYVLKGRLELTIKDTNGNGESESFVIEKGHFVSIQPKIIHTLKALDDSEFIDLNTVSRSADGYEDDTVRC